MQRPRTGRSTALVPAGRYQIDRKSLALSAGAAATRFCMGLVVRVLIFLSLAFGAAFAGLHAKLAHSPMSLSFLVPPIEKAINRTLTGLHFDIGNAVLRRAENGYGIEFRLADVRLLDDDDNTVAESPFASGKPSLRALLTGQFAASHVDLIGPRFYLQYSDKKGLTLYLTTPRASNGDPVNSAAEEIRSQPATGNQQPARARSAASPQTKEGLIRQARGRAVNLTHALTDLFAKTRQGQSAY